MEQPFTFDHQVVWITGASSGIGEALAYAFSGLGALLIISARSEAELNRVKENCNGVQETIFVLPLDLNKATTITAKAETALNRWGRIDCLVHNAGIASRALVQDMEMNIYRTVMETNYFGPVALTKAVLPSMLRSKKGQFVVISSLSGKYGVPRLSAYAASKHALHGFFESLRTEVAGQGIFITIVIPGFINTQIIKNSVDGQGTVTGRNLEVNEKGMSPQECARRIIRAIAKRKQEALIGGSEVWSVYLNRFFPQQFNKLMGQHPIKKLKRLLFWRHK
jgi:dehydrogenase/reductase SDR family member 7B